MNKPEATTRLEGLDLARYLAFVGMVIVNFNIVMGVKTDTGHWLTGLTSLLEGRAAATFVILAGFGLGLAAVSSSHPGNNWITIRRSVFLLVIGLLNSLIFDADILHYYAIYFLFGVLFIKFSNRRMMWLILLINLIFVLMILVLDYDRGWDWNTYTYSDFWTAKGFIRNLFFNGWHPVLPWLSFLLVGIMLSRFDNTDKTHQNRLILFGFSLYLTVELISRAVAALSEDQEIAILFSTAPIPPLPLYILAGVGIAMAVIGLCLKTAPMLRQMGILNLIAPAGRQTLTLYIAHILIGMGILESLDMLGNQTIETSIAASFIFCLSATIYAWIWSKWFKRGPVEWLMRKLAG